jgi:hypothetical protein
MNPYTQFEGIAMKFIEEKNPNIGVRSISSTEEEGFKTLEFYERIIGVPVIQGIMNFFLAPTVASAVIPYIGRRINLNVHDLDYFEIFEQLKDMIITDYPDWEVTEEKLPEPN